MITPAAVLAVFAGGALGGMARHVLAIEIDSRWHQARQEQSFPLGTLVVNLTGALVIGLCAGVLGFDHHGSRFWQLGILGFLGSYTTVSSFSLQALEMAREGRMKALGMLVGASMAGCLAAAGMGLHLGGILR